MAIFGGCDCREVNRRLETIERTLHGNGQPGVISQFHDLKSLSDKLDEAFRSQQRQHSQNRSLLLAILGGVLVNFVANHWSVLMELIK